MLPIRNLSGDTRLLNNITQIIRSKNVNGEKRLTLIAVPDEKNALAWEYVQNESIVIFEGIEYIIKNIQEKSVGNRSIKQVEAVQTFFNTMINCFQYETFSGSQTFVAALNRVFSPTPFNFSVVGLFLAQNFENFGRDNCLALFDTVLKRYGAEFEVVGNTVYLKNKIGNDTGYQLRWNHNIKALSKTVDTKGLATVIKGFGGKPNDNGVYPLVREYRSNVAVFGELHASAVYDERITTVTGMDTRLRSELIDEPQLSITVDIAEIKDHAGNSLTTISEGDRGFIIYEPMQIQVEARAVEINETFKLVNGKWSRTAIDVTLANLKERLTDKTTRFAQTSKQVERLFNGQETLSISVLPEAIRIASEAINNSLTEIKYPVGQGIVLQDPNNPNRLVRLTSAGIGLSEDGGATYRTAMTGVGIVADEVVTGILRANNVTIQGEAGYFFWDGSGLFAIDRNNPNKFVRLNSNGLYVANGAITIERTDGYKVINNGMIDMDLNIQGVEPAFHGAGVTLVQKGFAQWLSTRSTTSVDFNQYAFEHKARYLKLSGRLLSSSGNVAYLEVWRGGNVIATISTTEVDEMQPNGFSITVDLGVPDGSRGTFQIRIRSSVAGRDTYALVVRKWLEG